MTSGYHQQQQPVWTVKMLYTIFEQFVEENPVSVMARGLMERVFAPERMDRLFETSQSNGITPYPSYNIYWNCCFPGVSSTTLTNLCSIVLGIFVIKTASNFPKNKLLRRTQEFV
ncbi:MAG TPA: hypothetical protein V6D14_10350 [Coleofasciculaceae cyanobacterium]|jgi:hypothetical protein